MEMEGIITSSSSKQEINRKSHKHVNSIFQHTLLLAFDAISKLIPYLSIVETLASCEKLLLGLSIVNSCVSKQTCISDS
jgi:hypothetical protein